MILFSSSCRRELWAGGGDGVCVCGGGRGSNTLSIVSRTAIRVMAKQQPPLYGEEWRSNNSSVHLLVHFTFV